MHVQLLEPADDSRGQVEDGRGEGQGDESVEYSDVQDGERDVRCQLTTTQQELAAVKHHLAEARRENDDLLKAVSYLRSKLDHTAPDTSTDLHTNDNNDVTIATDGADDDDAEVEHYDDGMRGQRSSAEVNNYNSELHCYSVLVV